MLKADFVKRLARFSASGLSRSFGPVVVVLTGAVIGLTLCLCLLMDVWRNGHITSDLDTLGVFLLCARVFMAGGVNKQVKAVENKDVEPSKTKEQ